MLVVCGKVKMILEHAKHCPSQNCRNLSKPNLASIKDDLSVPENMVLVIPWGKILVWRNGHYFQVKNPQVCTLNDR